VSFASKSNPELWRAQANIERLTGLKRNSIASRNVSGSRSSAKDKTRSVGLNKKLCAGTKSSSVRKVA